MTSPGLTAQEERQEFLYGEAGQDVPGVDPATVLGTWRLLRSDLRRIRVVLAMPRSVAKSLFLVITPSFVAMMLHRWSHYWHLKGIPAVAWLLWALNLYITGADITPKTRFGHSAYLPHPNGVIVAAVLGHRCTLFGRSGVGGGRGEEDVGGGPGLPLIGNDVEIGHNSSVLGSVRIGDRATIGAHVLLMKDVSPGATVAVRLRSMVVAVREPGDHSGRILQ